MINGKDIEDMASDQNLLLKEGVPYQYRPGDVGFPPGSSQTMLKPGQWVEVSTEGLKRAQDYLDKTRESFKEAAQKARSHLPDGHEGGALAGPIKRAGSQATGLKYDDVKPRMDLLDPAWLEGVASVLTFGAKKYSANNWRGGINYSRLIAAAYRHLGAINRGEDIDPESGLPHVHHLSCTIMFLSWMMANKPELDDRYKRG